MPRKTIQNVSVAPFLGEDAAERKRVLNVLAQRRYRRRKKERLQALEARIQNSRMLEDSTSAIERTPSPQEHLNGQTPTWESSRETNFDILGISSTGNSDIVSSGIFGEVEMQLHDANYDVLPSICDPVASRSTNPFSVTDPFTYTSFEESSTSKRLETIWATSNIMSAVPQGQDPGQLEKSTLATLPQGSSPFDLSAELQADDIFSFTFPDDSSLKVPSLTLLNAAMKVAQRLNITEMIWDLSAVSPFYRGHLSSLNGSTSAPETASMVTPPSEMSSLDFNHSISLRVNSKELPLHLQPTSTQLLIAHHPILDLLPWPSTRDKLIQIFHLPAHQRPANARHPMGLIQLVHEMEDDSGEGIQIYGQDPFEPGSWEIGQIMLEKWWWAFEPEIVDRSNRARKKRGAKELTLGFGTDTGF